MSPNFKFFKKVMDNLLIILESFSEQCSRDKFKGVDILLTSEWPKGVDNFTKPPVRTQNIMYDCD